MNRTSLVLKGIYYDIITCCKTIYKKVLREIRGIPDASFEIPAILHLFTVN